MIHFVYPTALWLLPLPWLLARWLPASTSAAAPVLAVPQRIATLLAESAGGCTHAGRRLRALLVWLGWCALVFALAVPVTPGESRKTRTGRDLLVALDMSASMLARDVELDGAAVERYVAIKSLAHAFIRGRTGDRVGLIVFGNHAYLIAPLTHDVDAVAAFLDEVSVGLSGRRTALGDAIGLGIKTLREQPADSRVLILLSDGASNAGAIAPDAAARLARRHAVRIHTIGFGRDDDPSNQVDALATLAERSDGRHFVAESTDALRAVYRELDALEAIEEDALQVATETDWVRELLLVALAALTALTLGERRAGRV